MERTIRCQEEEFLTMSKCNRCVYEGMKRTGFRRIKSPETKFDTGGVNVYLVPFGEKLDRKKHFAAWFMEITDVCDC